MSVNLCTRVRWCVVRIMFECGTMHAYKYACMRAHLCVGMHGTSLTRPVLGSDVESACTHTVCTYTYCMHVHVHSPCTVKHIHLLDRISAGVRRQTRCESPPVHLEGFGEPAIESVQLSSSQFESVHTRSSHHNASTVS